jgi:hypothetical protein
MRLITHADASHHSVSQPSSLAGVVHYLGDNSDDTIINGPIDFLVSSLMLLYVQGILNQNMQHFLLTAKKP